MAAVLKHSPIMKAIACFSNHYSKIKLSIQFSDKVQDLVDEGVDIAIRIGDLKDSSLKSRCMLMVNRVVVAVPCFLAQHTTPKSLDDLESVP